MSDESFANHGFYLRRIFYCTNFKMYLTKMHTPNLHVAIPEDTTLVEAVGTLHKHCY